MLTIALIVFFALFISGFFLSEQQIDVAGCTARWSLLPVSVARSDLCPAGSCLASSDAQQHNAIVDALLCACSKAKSAQYSDAPANKRIEDVVKNFFGYSIGAAEACEQPGVFLTRRSYG